MLHMTYGQVFILVKGDLGEGKCIRLAGQQRGWPKGTALGDYLIIVGGQYFGQSPLKRGFWMSKAVCRSR